MIGHSPDVAVATFEQYVLLLWRRRVIAQGVHWTRQAFAEMRDIHPDGKLVFFTALEPQCDLGTPPEVRKGVAALLKEQEFHLACAAIVFEGEGFGIAIVRSVITAINMMSHSRFPNAVFDKVDPALSWVSNRARPHKVDLDPVRVRQAVDALRVL